MLTCCVQTSYLRRIPHVYISPIKRNTHVQKRKMCKNATSYLLLDCSEGENCTLILRGQCVENSRTSKKKKQTQVDSQVTNTSPCLKCKNRPVCSCRSLFATCWAGASSALPSLFSLIKINSLCAVNLFTVSHS